MIALLVWLVFGFIVGSLAEWLYPPKAQHSPAVTVALGAGGSVVGGLLGSVFSGSPYSPGGVVASVIGALLLSWLYRKYSEDAL